MKSQKSKNKEVPFGLPRIIAIGAYFVVISLTGMAVQASDPLQEMMKINNAYSHITNETERSDIISKVVGFGVTCAVLSGLFVGPVLDLLGAKITGLLGLALHSLGYIFMFYIDLSFLYWVSGFCFGIGYQFIQNCHLSAASLFPRNSNLILTLLAHYGNGPSGVKTAVAQYLFIFVTAAAIIDLLLLPMLPFTQSAKDADLEEKPLLQGDEDPERAVAKTTEQKTVPRYWLMSTGSQLGTLDYWLFVIFITFAFCRKKHFSVSIRRILREIDPRPDGSMADFYANMYNQIVPAGFIPAIGWGAVVDHFGINSCLFASNILGVGCCLLSLIPILEVQVITISVFILYQCFILGQVLAFFGSVFGFTTIATLQGICCFVTGILSLLMDIFWPTLITNVLGSYRNAGIVLTIVGCLMFIIPVILTKLDKKREAQETSARKSREEDGLFETVLPSIQVFDRGSLTLLAEQQRRSRLGSA